MWGIPPQTISYVLVLCEKAWKSLATFTISAGEWAYLTMVGSAQAILASPISEVGGQKKEGTWHPRGVLVLGTTEDDRD